MKVADIKGMLDVEVIVIASMKFGFLLIGKRLFGVQLC